MSVAAACSNGSAAGVQWQVNVIDGRGVFPAGVVVEVLNNDGVSKPVNATAIIDPAYTARVTVTSKEPFRSAVRWQWAVGRRYAAFRAWQLGRADTRTG